MSQFKDERPIDDPTTSLHIRAQVRSSIMNKFHKNHTTRDTITYRRAATRILVTQRATWWNQNSASGTSPRKAPKQHRCDQSPRARPLTNPLARRGRSYDNTTARIDDTTVTSGSTTPLPRQQEMTQEEFSSVASVIRLAPKPKDLPKPKNISFMASTSPCPS